MITSTKNESIVDVARLHVGRHRAGTGNTIVAGARFVADVVAAGADVMAIYALPSDEDATRRYGDRIIHVSDHVLVKIAGTKSATGPVAVVRIPEWSPLVRSDTVVLVAISDPGNVGAIIRSAVAFGFTVAVTPECADVWSPKVIRAAAAAQFSGRVVAVEDDTLLETLVGAGLTPLVTVAAGGTPPEALDSADERYAVLIGSEAHGLSESLMSAVPTRVSIPIAQGVDSLNAAVAAGIVLHAIATHRGVDQAVGDGARNRAIQSTP